MQTKISLNEAKENLEYIKETGDFVWIGKQFGITKGSIAGHIRTNDGYRRIQINGKTILAHRLVWLFEYGNVPSSMYEIDHIDGNRLNNKVDNLRLVTRSSNCKNTKVRRTNTSGVTGVHKVKRSGKYIARINGLNKERIVLGTFDNFEDAVKARKDAELIYGYHPNHGRAK